MRNKKTVFVALSGGVDSSVAAALLKRRGFFVVGVYMKGWQAPGIDCAWKQDRQDAARVAALLNIPFKVYDFSREYYEHVVAYLIDEYKNNRTPNPDILCNKYIKFGLFLERAKKEGADYIATGHYARFPSIALGTGRHIRSGRFYIHTARDTNKDQSYFLWTLTPEQLQFCLFPIGEFIKLEVRAMARSFHLPTAEKKDSQGVCFVGKLNMREFLKQYIDSDPGKVRTTSGEIVGNHDGLPFYTIGQRHGIGIGGGVPYYVAEKDVVTGTLTVAKKNEAMLYKNELKMDHTSWMYPIVFPLQCKARIRYRQPLADCVVKGSTVQFTAPQRAVASGQSVVFYKNNRVLGGGVIV